MKAHKRKVNMKVLCREQSENRRKNIFRASLRKLFYCDVYHVSICAQHAENPLKCVHDDRRFRKRRWENGKLFLPFPLHYILWNIHEIHVPRFTMECAAIPKNREKCKKLSACIFHLSVVLFSGRRAYSFLTPFDEHSNSPWVPCCSQFFTRAVYTARPTIRIKRERRTLSEKKERKNFFQLSTLFRNYFLCFFIFPSFPFQSFANIS